MRGDQSMKIMSFDPGNTTGVILYDSTTKTCVGRDLTTHGEVYSSILKYTPKIVIYETFHLFPSKVRSLAWNTFYPCEVIGVIKLAVAEITAELRTQPPSIKPYSTLEGCPKGSKHVKDAYRHLWYYLNVRGGVW
jgi:hypothetical protein